MIAGLNRIVVEPGGPDLFLTLHSTNPRWSSRWGVLLCLGGFLLGIENIWPAR